MNKKQNGFPIKQEVAKMNNLPAYRVFLSDGTNYATSMAHGITLDDAKSYFLGRWFVDEDDNGKETKRQVVNVTEVR